MRVPIYFQAERDTPNISFGVGLTGLSLPLGFTAGEAGPVTLEDNGILGALALSWLENRSIPGGRRTLLGYVVIPSADSRIASSLRFYAVIVNW